MTEQPEQPEQIEKIKKSDQPEPSQSKPTDKASKDRKVKMAFGLIVVVVILFVWHSQGKDPELVGWLTDYDTALAQAKQQHTQVAVFVTRRSMGQDDKRMIGRCMTHPRVEKALDYLGFVKLHQTNADKAFVDRYDIKTTPATLLLDSDGKLIKKQEGYQSDVQYANTFLGVQTSVLDNDKEN